MHRRRRSPPLTTATINGVLYFFSHPALNGEFGMV
uniref:Uncharacterized protein n=1 Tax=Fagus sylvatica TaxID=28930 RepID=A0A2N9EWR2_FAGSY